jgi:CheY-like chemotaxis protein
VLVIEDNDDARISLCRLLELLGHRVRTASDGPTGLSISIEAGPELVLIDVGLPGMDGYEVARRLRAARGTRVTLVALTGYGMPEDRERALAAGFDEHLVKPVDLAVLMRLLA